MKELTKAEEQVMQVMWKIKKGFINDILEHFPKPKPAYNTVSTIVRILEKKGFIAHNAYGKTHEYYAAVTKDKYKKSLLGGLLKNYFDNSVQQMVSFFTKDKSLSLTEMDELLNFIEKEKEKQIKTK